MGKKIPTNISFFRAIFICLLAVFRPSRLAELEKQDSVLLESAPSDDEPRIKKVHHAFWASLVLILVFGTLGVVAGFILRCFYGVAPSSAINILQIIGAGLLLWGTLFVRGFEIESYACVTLSERVNQWLYRTMYCIGTAVIICSLAWASN
jgi:hypothetical protein